MTRPKRTQKTPAAPSKLRSVSRPKQARSEATLARLLDAGEALIRDHGLAQVSIAAIAAEAGSSVGGFYARFKDKDELLRALHEREQHRFRAAIAEVADPGRWTREPLGDLIGRALEIFFGRIAGRRRLAAAFLESAARHPDRWRHAVAFRRETVEAFVALLLLRADAIDHPDPQRAARFAIHQVLATVDQRAIFEHVGEDDGGQLDDDALRVELTRSLCRYLGVDPPE